MLYKFSINNLRNVNTLVNFFRDYLIINILFLFKVIQLSFIRFLQKLNLIS